MGDDVITNVISAPPPERLEKLAPGEGGWGVLPYKSDGSARRKISKTPQKGTRIFFMGVFQIHF